METPHTTTGPSALALTPTTFEAVALATGHGRRPSLGSPNKVHLCEAARKPLPVLCGQYVAPERRGAFGQYVGYTDAELMQHQGWGNRWQAVALGDVVTCLDCQARYRAGLGVKYTPGLMAWVGAAPADLPPGFIPPGRFIYEEMQQAGLSWNELAAKLGQRGCQVKRAELLAISRGKERISTALAYALGSLWPNYPAAWWADMQAAADTDLASYAHRAKHPEL